MHALRGAGRRLGYNLVRFARRARARSVLGPSGGPRRSWLLVRVGPRLPERRVARRLLATEPQALALVDLLRSLDVAAGDPRVAGVVLRFEGSPGSFSTAEALRRAVGSLRKAGKPVWAWSESFDALSYYVASAADRIDVPPTGSLQLVGLRSQQPFLGELLRKVGVRAEVVRVGSNKAAAEPLVRRKMSEPQREQVTAYQTELFDELVRGIASGRDLAEELVRQHIDEGPHGAQAALERGLFDGCRYPDEVDGALREELEAGAGGEDAPDTGSPPTVDVSTYFSLVGCDVGRRPLLRELPRVAYVVVEGPIRLGRSTRGVASQRYRELFRRLMLDDELCGVVLRIASPGGDAVASDLLHRAIAQLAACKPVVVSMADVAASGGYYLAAAAHCVLAERTTLTGSIGVVGGKLDLSGLYARIGIDVDAVESGERAGLYSETRGFTPSERQALQAEMRSLYETFKQRVAEGRSLAERDVEKAAQGRIWSGERARVLQLVDALGGPLEALAEVRERAGLEPAAPFLLEVHPQRPALRDLGGVFSPFSSAAGRARADFG